MDINAPDGWYKQDETVVKSWNHLKEVIGDLLTTNSDRNWVWRGQPNAEFALTSSLYRHLTKKHTNGAFKFPTELEMQTAERKLISHAKGNFRLGNGDALDLFARLQHLGAPTRFIDVTKNPFAAVWFAAQPHPKFENSDARIFAFGVSNHEIYHPSIAEPTASGEPPWFDAGFVDWGLGNLSVWFPPFGTHQRVFAQNAGFIFDGLPTFGSGSNSNYKKRDIGSKPQGNWRKPEIAQATCIDVNFVNWKRKARVDSQKLPVYTFRIPAKHRKSILRKLEGEMGIAPANLFPGMDGLAQLLANGNLELE